jgi:di/tricarboxylate transporter
MIAASAAFATPFGYQTNVIVYQMAGYRYMDFVRVGLPLNLITCAVAIPAILAAFPF